MQTKTLIVTGGAGFIGCNFVRYALAQPGVEKLVVVDKLTYAGSLLNLVEPTADSRFIFVQADIADRAAMDKVYAEHKPTALLNFAAETHVDRSIDGPEAFIRSNIHGVFTLLECAREWMKTAPDFRFLQVSTDEVYGTLGATGLFEEETPYAPNSPYSASKAAADHLVRAYHHTYGMDVVITNCSNNYGPYQFPEKLIPLVTLNALEGKDLPVYGDGGNIRDWLHVQDHCSGIWLALTKGRSGEKYNVGGNNERNNLQIVKQICVELEKARPAAQNPALKARGKATYADLITFVKDRPGHDRRYAIDATKIRKELGWAPTYDCESGLAQTVRWYADNSAWCQGVQEGKYQRERLGTGKA